MKTPKLSRDSWIQVFKCFIASSQKRKLTRWHDFMSTCLCCEPLWTNCLHVLIPLFLLRSKSSVCLKETHRNTYRLQSSVSLLFIKSIFNQEDPTDIKNIFQGRPAASISQLEKMTHIDTVSNNTRRNQYKFSKKCKPLLKSSERAGSCILNTSLSLFYILLFCFSLHTMKLWVVFFFDLVKCSFCREMMKTFLTVVKTEVALNQF